MRANNAVSQDTRFVSCFDTLIIGFPYLVNALKYHFLLKKISLNSALTMNINKNLIGN